ncbi:hypothetical protein ES703_13192 [subsurface metagenome]
MSFRGLHTKITFKALFPFTWRGIFFLILALIILGLGIFRIELASMLWGSGFLLLALYSLAGGHLYRFITARYLSKKLDAVDCNLPTRGCSGDEGLAEIKVELPRIAVPGIQVRFIHQLYFQDRPPIRLQTLLSPGINRKVLDFSLKKRGFYKSSAACLEFRDMLGFTRHSLEVPLAEQMRVIPAVRSLEEWLRRMEEGGDAAEFKKIKKRSEELLEVRKYFPGDDHRKINWKIFAHLGELLIRIGEKTPPPKSRFLIVLDSNRTDSVPERLAGDYLDGMVETCASLMNHLLLKGLNIMFTTSGGGDPRTFSLEKRGELLSMLAEIWWTEPEALELPAQKKMQVILLSSPGSSGLQRTVSSLSSRGWEISLYLKGLYFSPPAIEPLTLKSILFLPEKKESSDHQNMEKILSRFGEALARELAKYRNAPWSLADVSEI